MEQFLTGLAEYYSSVMALLDIRTIFPVPKSYFRKMDFFLVCLVGYTFAEQQKNVKRYISEHTLLHYTSFVSSIFSLIGMPSSLTKCISCKLLNSLIALSGLGIEIPNHHCLISN
jgi:hypothetical protein